MGSIPIVTTNFKTEIMQKGVVIYLFDEDLSDRVNMVKDLTIDDIKYSSFMQSSMTYDQLCKASIVVYVSNRFQDSKTLKNKYGTEIF